MIKEHVLLYFVFKKAENVKCYGMYNKLNNVTCYLNVLH